MTRMALAAKRLPGDEIVYVKVVPVREVVRHPEARYRHRLVLAVHEAPDEPVALGALLVVDARSERLSRRDVGAELMHGPPAQLGLARCDLARLAHQRQKLREAAPAGPY